jgi:predicted acyltransferase
MTIIAKEQAIKQRLLSLDFFRGITVATMILVNNPGDWGHIYAPLEHSKWNGCTPTDLVFPFFLFIVGVSIVYAFENKKADISLHKKLILRAGRRSVMIFAIALLLNLIPNFDFANLRILGVLPRIAIVFFICVVLYIKTNKRTQAWILFLILVVYYLLMNFVPVPGLGYSNLEPGTNLAAWLDNIILTPAHMWSGTKTWDPEGVLSTLPAISTGLLGVLTGTWLKRTDRGDAEKVAWMFSASALLIVGGLVWNGFFPMNKALWTSSFVLYAGGLATAGLALSYWLIDVHHRTKFIRPFVAYGANAITVYVGSGLIPLFLSYIIIHSNGKATGLTQYMYEIFFASWLSPINASLASAVAYVLLLMVPLLFMYKKKIFIKI